MKRIRLILCSTILCFTVLAFVQPNLWAEQNNPGCARLVSLAPSVTESLFFLGLGKNLVAGSQFDNYPKEALDKPRVGALFGTSLEGLLSFKPSSVILLDEQSQISRQLDELGLKNIIVDHRSVSGILSGLKMLADYCNTAVGLERTKVLEKKYKDWLVLTKQLQRPKVLVLLASAANSGKQQSAYVLGRDGYYNDLILAAGGQSAYTGMTRLLPDVSYEGLLSLDPEVLIIVSESDQSSSESLKKQITALLPSLDAVKKKRVYIMNEDYLLVPGPRFVSSIKQFFKIIHPTINSAEKLS